MTADWVVVLKTIFLEIWLYILVIAVGILLLIGLLLGIWYSLYSDKSYRYKKKIKPMLSEIESASVFVGSRVTSDIEQLPPFPKSRDQDLPPPVPSLLLSVRRSRQDSVKIRYPDDGYSSNSDEDREAIRRDRSLERRRYDAEIMSRRPRSDYGTGIIEATVGPRQTSQTLDRFTHRNDEVFQSASAPSRPSYQSPKKGESSESYHGNHGNHTRPDSYHGNHASRLSSNIDNTIETRLSSHQNSPIRTQPASPDKMVNVRSVGQYPAVTEVGVRSTIYLNQDCQQKPYPEEKAYINNSLNRGKHESFYHNNPGESGTGNPDNHGAGNHGNPGNRGSPGNHGSPGSPGNHGNPGNEAIYVNHEELEEGEDYYTDGFSPPLHIETNVVYQNHGVNQDTYQEYEEQAYSNSGAQAYHDNGNHSNGGSYSNSNNYSNDGHYTPQEDDERVEKEGVYQNHDVRHESSSDDEFIEFEDVSIYVNQPDL